MCWQLLWNNILHLVFLVKKISGKDNIGCALFKDLLRMRYSDSIVPYNHTDEGYQVVRGGERGPFN